jgi:hypothetical protein
MAIHLRMPGAIIALLILGGCATTSGNMPPKADSSAAAEKNPACQTETTRRVGVNGTNCIAFGRSYTENDIKRTGATNAADALRLLDSSVWIQGGAGSFSH